MAYCVPTGHVPTNFPVVFAEGTIGTNLLHDVCCTKMLTVFGTLVLDTIHAPGWNRTDMLGGSATYAAMSAGLYTRPGLVACVGTDMPKEHIKMISDHTDTQGLKTIPGETFRYEARYENHFERRIDIGVKVGVTEKYRPTIPDRYRESEFVYLANSDPHQQKQVLEQFESPRLTMCDTIQHWIGTKNDEVVELAGMVDGVILNADEARSLAGQHNLTRCARIIQGWGAKFVVVKKAEHGSILFIDDTIYPMAGFPLDDLVDPTGAGDSFAGSMMGYLDSVNGTSNTHLRRACVHGNVLGSFAVSGIGTAGLAGLDRKSVEGRARQYAEMLCGTAAP